MRHTNFHDKPKGIYSSDFFGVSYEEKYKDFERPWKAQVMTNDKRSIFLGYYTTPEAAALAYNDYIVKTSGDPTRINLGIDSGKFREKRITLKYKH